MTESHDEKERTETPERDRERHAVLNVFGLTLEVSNPRLAELLTMDAGQALTTDLRELGLGGGLTEGTLDASTVTQAIPDAVVAPHTAQDELAARLRKEFRARVRRAGEELGFETFDDGTWRSPVGVRIITRAIERPISLAAATHFVGEVARLVAERQGSDEACVLFVTHATETSDLFKVAIRQHKAHDTMRTATIDHIERMCALVRGGSLTHKDVVMLIAPVADIDVGELLAVITCGLGDPGTKID